MDSNSNISAALAYAARGWAVFPLHGAAEGACSCGRTDCDRTAKHPRTPNGLKDATKDEATIRKWWAEWPDANIGIATGAVSGLVVLDVDGEEGRATVKGLELPISPLAETGRGRHVYFAHPGKPVQNQQKGGWFSRKYPGLDIRGDGGYVVAPPSVHATGRTYSWHPELGPGTPLAAWPDWLLADRDARKGPAPPLPEKIQKGKRQPHLLSLAGSMRRRGAGESEILAALEAVNAARCDPPYERARLAALAKDVAKRYQPAEGCGGPKKNGGPTDVGPDGYAMTDLGNAERLVAACGGELRHVGTWGKWLVWSGARWVKDETGEVVRKLVTMIRGLYGRAADLTDTAEKKSWVGFLAKSESRPRIEAAVVVAENLTPVAVPHMVFDSLEWSLNCLNGTVDLRSGTLRIHDPADHLTKLAPCEYAPTATAPEWDAFLEIIMPDAATRDFLRRAIGYSITGDVSEQVIFFLWGRGANGKSTFLNVLRHVLGDYAMRAAPDLLTAKEYNTHPAERADLAGARFVILTETERGERLAEALVKDLTGGDTIKARFLYRDFFEFRPTHKIWLAANHKPEVRGADYAIWRRICMVPFAVTIPPEKQDRKLEERLLAERNGILRWAVDGCIEWQNSGLAAPEAVRTATAEYRASSDILAEWIDAECETGNGCEAQAGELYRAYAGWCEREKDTAVKRGTFGRMLEERGFDSRRDKARRWRRGICLTSQKQAGQAKLQSSNGGSSGAVDNHVTVVTDKGQIQETSLTRARVWEELGENGPYLSPSLSAKVTHSALPEWFAESLPSFVAFVGEKETVFRGTRDPASGRWFAGDPVPAGVPEPNLAVLRARGATTRLPPPAEAATCPRCAGTWCWGGVHGWVWTCCGRPVK